MSSPLGSIHDREGCSDKACKSGAGWIKVKDKRFIFEQKTVVSTSDGDSMLMLDDSCLYLLDEREEVDI